LARCCEPPRSLRVQEAADKAKEAVVLERQVHKLREEDNPETVTHELTFAVLLNQATIFDKVWTSTLGHIQGTQDTVFFLLLLLAGKHASGSCSYVSADCQEQEL
jgi:hypothetical protein